MTSKPSYFRFDPESVDDRMVRAGELLGKMAPARLFTSALFHYSDKRLEQRIRGIAFRNPIGLAGGFDKNARLTDILPSLGFGFAEVGSITGEPCEDLPQYSNSPGLFVVWSLCRKIIILSRISIQPRD